MLESLLVPGRSGAQAYYRLSASDALLTPCRYTRQYDNYQSLQNAVKNIFFW